jgi:hypothetical protein
MAVKIIKAPVGATENEPAKSLSPHLVLDSICSFTHGFIVGYFLPSLRDLRYLQKMLSPLPVSKKVFRLESTRGQPQETFLTIVEPALKLP